MKIQRCGVLRKGGEILFESIFEVEDFETRPGGTKDWRGSFTLPAGTLLQDGCYNIELEDGFTGAININGDKYAGHDATVEFKGSGPPNWPG